MSSIFLGVDIGTSSAKCLAVGADGQAMAFAQHHYTLSRPREGWAEQDPQELWNALVDVVSRCVAACKTQGHSETDIASLAMSTQGEILIVTDRKFVPVVPAMSWMDGRATDECAALLAEADQDFWYRETGVRLTSLGSACKLQWIRHNLPEAWRRIGRVCSVPDFLAARMTGRFAIDAPSASWGPFFSPRMRTWNDEVIGLLGVDRAVLPAAIESGGEIGELLPQAAEAMGLPMGAKLIAGAFDQTAAAHGAGARANDRAVLSCGTAWVLYSVTEYPVLDATGHLPICCHVSPNEWGLVLPFSGGATYDWLNRTVIQDTSAPTDAEPPVFIPHLYGGVCPDWREDSRGSLLGLTMSHTPADIRLALMRGVASDARRNVEAAEKIGGRISSVRMVGGAGKSHVWPQMIANILARPVEVSGLVESACYGAAKLAAGKASADWALGDSVNELLPVPEAVAFENQQYCKYLRFYEDLLPVYASQ